MAQKTVSSAKLKMKLTTNELGTIVAGEMRVSGLVVTTPDAQEGQPPPKPTSAMARATVALPADLASQLARLAAAALVKG